MRWLRDNTSYWSRSGYAATIAAMLLAAVYLLFTNLRVYNISYDSGVYLESARMMGRGFMPYRQIFDSQPPLWLPLIYGSFRLFGESPFAGQMVTAIAGLITLAAVIVAALQLGGKGGSIVAGILVITSPLELEWSRTLNGDVPSIALAATGIALAIAYAKKRRRRWLIAAASAATCAILIKLSGLYAVPALTLFVIARWQHDRKVHQRLRSIAQDLLMMLGVAAGITLLTGAMFRSGPVWSQVVTFHWAARQLDLPVTLYDRWRMFAHLMAGERLLIMFAPLAALCLLAGGEGFALCAWPFFTFLGLLEHRPLFDHHLVAMIPALAATIGVGADYTGGVVRPLIRWIYVQPGPIAIAGGTIGLAAGLTILALGIYQAGIETTQQRALLRGSPLLSQDLQMASLIDQHTHPNDMIITDDQGIAFLAARDVPPGLADTSFVRIAGGYLQPQEAIAEGERYQVRLMLLWTGRLGMMPEVVRWADARFPHRVAFGRGQVLYSVD